MGATITRRGTYQNIVSTEMVRDTLNLRAGFPSDSVLQARIAEAARRVEALTRMVFPTQTWDYTLTLEGNPESLSIPGLFPVTGSPSLTVTDEDGTALTVTAKVQGRGESLLVTPGTGKFEPGDLTVSVSRGVAPSEFPEDLRAAVITAVEQLVDGFTPQAERFIIATCSRYGYIG